MEPPWGEFAFAVDVSAVYRHGPYRYRDVKGERTMTTPLWKAYTHDADAYTSCVEGIPDGEYEAHRRGLRGTTPNHLGDAPGTTKLTPRAGTVKVTGKIRNHSRSPSSSSLRHKTGFWVAWLR